MNFTSQQLDAINSTYKKNLILACAGSGKTSVVVGRINYLKEKGINPEQILALTFSNKAAKEMKERIRKSDRNFGRKVNVKTFHSFGLEIINSYFNTLGFTEKVSIVMKDECNAIIRDIYKNRNEKAIDGNDIFAYIHQFKSSEPYVKQDYFEEIVRLYCDALKEKNMVDMDDMIYLPILLLKDYENIRTALCQKYKCIFVDEYQDTNTAQNLLLDYVTNDETDLFLVGDDDQAIYEWRGARPEFILKKSVDSRYHCIKLETNFRSQSEIISLANTVISQNTKRVYKSIGTSREGLIKPMYKRFYSEEAESNWVAATIKELIKSNRFNPSDIAVLYRNNKQFESIKKALKESSINFDTLDVDDTAKYSRFIKVLKSICDLSTVNILSEAINFPNRCFDKFAFEDAKNAYCDEYGQDKNYETMEWINKIYLSDVIFDGCKEFRDRYELISQLHEAKTMSATEVIACYLNYMKRCRYDETEPDQFEMVLQAFDIAKNYEKAFGKTAMPQFVEHLILSYENNDADLGTDIESVNVLTMHRAKGLEFKVVFIIGVQVGIFPNDFFIDNEYKLECERRLFYVAITRAKELLYISSYQDPLGGSFENTIIKHGFLAEIPTLYFGSIPSIQEILNVFPEKEFVENTKAKPEDAKNVVNQLIKPILVETTKEANIDNNKTEDKYNLSEEVIDEHLAECLLLSKNIEIPHNYFIVIVGALDVKLSVAQAILKENGFSKDQVEFYDYSGKGFNISKYLFNSRCLGIIVGPQAHKIENIDAKSLKGKLIRDEGYPFSVDLINRHISKHTLQEAITKIKWNYKNS